MTTSATIGTVSYRFYREIDISCAKKLFAELCKILTQEEFEDRMESEDIDFIYNVNTESK